MLIPRSFYNRKDNVVTKLRTEKTDMYIYMRYDKVSGIYYCSVSKIEYMDDDKHRYEIHNGYKKLFCKTPERICGKEVIDDWEYFIDKSVNVYLRDKLENLFYNIHPITRHIKQKAISSIESKFLDEDINLDNQAEKEKFYGNCIDTLKDVLNGIFRELFNILGVVSRKDPSSKEIEIANTVMREILHPVGLNKCSDENMIENEMPIFEEYGIKNIVHHGEIYSNIRNFPSNIRDEILKTLLIHVYMSSTGALDEIINLSDISMRNRGVVTNYNFMFD